MCSEIPTSPIQKRPRLFLRFLVACHRKLEDLVRNTIEASKSKGPTSEFPASRLKKILDHYLQDNVRPQERAALRTQLGPLVDVVERYVGGLKAHEVHVMANLLACYADTEKCLVVASRLVSSAYGAVQG